MDKTKDILNVINEKTVVPLFVIIAAGIVIVPLIIWASKADTEIQKVPKIEKSIIYLNRKVDRLLILQGENPEVFEKDDQ